MNPIDQAQAADLVSERILLRRFVESDAAFVLEMHSNPDLIRFIPSAAMTTLPQASAWLAQNSEEVPARGWRWWCISLHDGTPVGAAVLKPLPISAGREAEVRDEFEVGWRLHPDHTGHGYATEAGRLLLTIGHASGLDKLLAVVKSDNHASRAICRRIGMEHHGLSRDYYDEAMEVFAHRKPAEALPVKTLSARRDHGLM